MTKIPLSATVRPITLYLLTTTVGAGESVSKTGLTNVFQMVRNGKQLTKHTPDVVEEITLSLGIQSFKNLDKS